MANFTDILNKPAETVEKPKPRPVGTYLCIVDGPHKQRDVKGKDGTEYPVVGFTFKTMQAQEDVDQAALAEAGGVGNNRANACRGAGQTSPRDDQARNIH